MDAPPSRSRRVSGVSVVVASILVGQFLLYTLLPGHHPRALILIAPILLPGILIALAWLLHTSRRFGLAILTALLAVLWAALYSLLLWGVSRLPHI